LIEAEMSAGYGLLARLRAASLPTSFVRVHATFVLFVRCGEKKRLMQRMIEQTTLLSDFFVMNVVAFGFDAGRGQGICNRSIKRRRIYWRNRRFEAALKERCEFNRANAII
jgi:hypothetical protein